MKRNYIFLALLAIIFAGVYIYVFDSKLDLNGDNAIYLRLADTMSKGHGYSSATIDGFKPASHFPPGYSTFLAFFMLFGIHSLVFFKVLNGLLFFASLVLLFFIIKRSTQNTPLAFVTTALPIFSPQLQHFSNMVMSEMLFFFFSVLCIYSLFQYTRNKKDCFWTSPWFYVTFISAAFSYHVRTVGMANIFAVVVFFLFRKEWKQTLFSFLGVVLLIIPWIIRNSVHGIESRYFGTIMTVNPWRPESGTISTFGELVEKMIHNFDETVIKGFKEILFPFMNIDYGTASGFLAVAGGLLIVAVVFWGAWNLKEIRWALFALLVGHIGLFMLWHGGNGSRYVVPIAPFIYICFYTGIYSALKMIFKKENKFTQNMAYIFLVMILAMWPAVKSQAMFSKQPYPPAYQNYFAIAKEMEKQMPEGRVCCCRKPELFTYYAPKLFAANYLYSTEPDKLIEDLVKKQVDFVILEQLGYGSTPRYLYPAIQQYPELFPIIWHLPNPDTYLFKFERKKATELFAIE